MPISMERHENKAQPADIPYFKIVAAYGLRECPKLVEQVAGDNLEVRVNALSVLCDEFLNPQKVFGCGQAGAIKILSCMVIDPDYTTRARASKALAIAAKDANGLAFILEDEAVIDLLNGINDPSDEVRGNIYDCISKVTRSAGGIEACVKAGVTNAFVSAVVHEVDALKPPLLRSIHNIAGSPQGADDALSCGAVSVCTTLLASSHSETVVEAARTLGFLCSHESGKHEALFDVQAGEKKTSSQVGALGPLVALLGAAKESKKSEIKAAAAMAVMSITSTDEGKRQVARCDNNHRLVTDLLYELDRTTRLCAVKVIANIAVNPSIRASLATDRMALGAMKQMAHGEDEDPLLARHAKIALDAVQWKP